MLVPREVKLGMIWRTDGDQEREFEVTEREVVETPWGERTQWQIRSTNTDENSAGQGLEVTRTYVEGVGLTAVTPDLAMARSFPSSIRNPGRPVDALPNLGEIPVRRVQSSAGEDLVFEGAARFISAWSHDDGRVRLHAHTSFVDLDQRGYSKWNNMALEFILDDVVDNATTRSS